MERIELFDKYIKNQLSKEERDEFDVRLKSDQEFASDFKMFLFTVDGVCREAEQDNLDFGVAMKGLYQFQLDEIIGKHQEEREPVEEDALSNNAFHTDTCLCNFKMPKLGNRIPELQLIERACTNIVAEEASSSSAKHKVIRFRP